MPARSFTMSTTATPIRQEVTAPAKQTTALKSEDSGVSAQEDIARLAYALWEQRGCPIGLAEFDWFDAEQQLKK
jgi:hypothetical protein